MRICLLALLLSWGAAARAEAPPLFTFESGEVRRAVTLPWLESSFPTTEISVEHPLYEQQMTFEAIPLQPIIEHLGWAGPGQLRFRCADGYRPVVDRADVATLGLALAYAQKTPAPADGAFAPIPTDRGPLDPGPFIVIAAHPEGNSHSKFSWPYQVVGVEPIEFADQYADILPKGAAEGSPAARGFQVFRTYCLSCHGLNLKGGVVGPELNIPKNITEYRTADYLRRFIDNPSAWRARSKMPAFGFLGPEKIADLIAYLTHMKDHKRLDALP